MPVVFGGIAPHPPIAVPEVARGRDRAIEDTQEAMLMLGKRLTEKNADVLVIITPHGPVFSDAIGVFTTDPLRGDLGQFGAPAVNFEEKCHPLAEQVVAEAKKMDLPAAALDQGIMRRLGQGEALDHGVQVPLYFLKKAGVDLPLVVVSIGLLPYEDLYRFGSAIRKAADQMNVRAAVVASGDLSHKLTKDAPAGFSPEGEKFDRKFVELIGNGDVQGIFDLDPQLVSKAGECGLRPVIMALGAMDGMRLNSEVMSYEGPFGVGYMVADLGPGEFDESRKLLNNPGKNNSSEGESPHVKLARQTLENYITGKQQGEVEVPDELLNKQAGVFVSIKKRGQLRGCIGTIGPTKENLAEEIKENAINAGTRDPRFNPITPEELDDLEYHVDVLGDAEPVKSVEDLDPKKYGVIVVSGPRKGLLLPDLEGVDTVDKQLSIAMQKAGIGPGEDVEIYRFKVDRYT